MVDSKRGSGKTKSSFKKLSPGYKILVLIAIAAICLGAIYGTIWGLQQIGFLSGGEVSTTPAYTTIELSSHMDGEDVSWVEVDFLVPKSSATFDDPDDYYTLSNFESLHSSKDADEINVDMRDHECAWIKFDPDGDAPFSSSYKFISGGANAEYKWDLYDLTSDVNFNMLTSTLDEVTMGDYATNGNFTIIADCPHDTQTAAQLHVGDDWAMDDDDFDDLSASDKAEYYDEKYWACQAPLYDPSVDTDKDFDDDLERLTSAFCFKFTFNATISTADAATTQINCSINDASEPIEVVFSGAYIYMVFYDIIDFKYGAYSFTLELEFGTHIHLDDVDSGRVSVPGDDDTVTAFVKYSDVAA